MGYGNTDDATIGSNDPGGEVDVSANVGGGIGAGGSYSGTATFGMRLFDFSTGENIAKDALRGIINTIVRAQEAQKTLNEIESQSEDKSED